MTDTERLIFVLQTEAHQVRCDRLEVERSVVDGASRCVQYGTWRLVRVEELLTKAAAEIERLSAEEG